MKNNRYEVGDDMPVGVEAGDIVSKEVEGIIEPPVDPLKKRSRRDLENQLDDALKRIEALEAA